MSFVFALHKTTLKLERTMHKFTKARCHAKGNHNWAYRHRGNTET
ncbi:hypothetical protein, partial [Escherichia coli]